MFEFGESQLPQSTLCPIRSYFCNQSAQLLLFQRTRKLFCETAQGINEQFFFCWEATLSGRFQARQFPCKPESVVMLPKEFKRKSKGKTVICSSGKQSSPPEPNPTQKKFKSNRCIVCNAGIACFKISAR